MNKFRPVKVETTIHPNLWDVAKAVLAGTYIAINAKIKKIERSQIINQTLYLKELEKAQC